MFCVLGLSRNYYFYNLSFFLWCLWKETCSINSFNDPCFCHPVYPENSKVCTSLVVDSPLSASVKHSWLFFFSLSLTLSLGWALMSSFLSSSASLFFTALTKRLVKTEVDQFALTGLAGQLCSVWRTQLSLPNIFHCRLCVLSPFFLLQSSMQQTFIFYRSITTNTTRERSHTVTAAQFWRQKTKVTSFGEEGVVTQHKTDSLKTKKFREMHDKHMRIPVVLVS